MTDIDIPFNDWSSERHEHGDKRATTRTDRYGDSGDRFVDKAAGMVFELTHVVRVPLGVVAEQFYEVEGAGSTEEFVEIWGDIHYRRGYDPEWPVWLHLYREVEPDPRPTTQWPEDAPDGRCVGSSDTPGEASRTDDGEGGESS